MNMSKKVLAGLLACTMMASLAACGGKTPKPEATSAPEDNALYTAGTYTGVSEYG